MQAEDQERGGATVIDEIRERARDDAGTYGQDVRVILAQLTQRDEDLNKLKMAVAAVRVATPENYQDAVFELDDVLIDLGAFSVNNDVRKSINAELAQRRAQVEAMRTLLSELFAYTTEVEEAMGPWIITRPYMASLPGTPESRNALGDKVRAALEAQQQQREEGGT